MVTSNEQSTFGADGVNEFELLLKTDPILAFKTLVAEWQNTEVEAIYLGELENIPKELKRSRLQPAQNHTLEVVESEGGHEGEGEYVCRVYAVVNAKGESVLYVRQTGFYESYNGTEWDDTLVQVYPREVMVTQYHETP